MKHVSKVGIVILAMLLTFSSVYAREGGRKARGGGHGKILKQLDLTDKQKQEMKAYRKDNRSERKAIREKIKAARKRMKTAFTSTASDSELTAIHKEITSLRNQLGEMKFNKMLKMRSVLTQEQRIKFQKLKEEMRDKKRNRNDD